MRNTYIVILIIYVLSFIILLGVHFLIYRPLVKITNAAKQYASGNLDVVIPVNTQDEIGYLSASLNYMSSQLKDMEDYQKKFVANVSHDFRSPLTSIKGYVEAMADGTIPPEMQGKYLNIILFETERLTDLTRDLLTLNEFDTKDLLLDKTDFDIHEVIRNTAASFEGTCTAKKISIELLLATRTLYVHADRHKIQQVLYNLLDNAIKFSNPESTITIETTPRGDKVYTSVKDYGIGIPKSSINKIWERFYKSDLSRGKDKKGTGLGLSIVKEIIQAHNENINVISTEGVGTEFIFSLPLTKK
jgi:signal transduction histidine kinase